MAIHLPPELDLCFLRIVDTDVRPGQPTQLRDPRARQRRNREECAEGLTGRRDRLLELLTGENRPALGQRDLGALGLQHECRRDRALPPEPSSRELVDLADNTENYCDGGLALAIGPHLPNKPRKVIGHDRIKPSRPERWPQMLVDDGAVFGLRGLTEVKDWTLQPAVRRLPELELRLRRDALAAGPPSGEIIAELARRQNPAIDRPPPLATNLIFEPDFEHASCPAIDPALDTNPTRPFRRRLSHGAHH